MEQIEFEILEHCHILFENLGITEFQLFDESNLDVLFEDQIYIEIFKIMFPDLKSEFEAIEDTNLESHDKIQMLIDYLASEILKIDLNHIEGSEISKGNLKHILHIVQLLAEVSNLCKLKSNTHSERGDRSNISEDPGSKERLNEEDLLKPLPKESVPNQEFKTYLEENKDSPYENIGEEEEEVSEILEVSKSKELSENGKKSKEKKLTGRNKKQKKKSKDPKIAEIENIYDKIKNDLEAPSQNEVEVYEKDPIDYQLLDKESSNEKKKGQTVNFKKTMKPKKAQNISTRNILKEKKNIKKNIEKNIFSAKVLGPRYITEDPKQKLAKKDHLNLNQKVDYVTFLNGGPEKIESIKKSLGLQMEAKQEVENIYEILCENIEKIKENLESMKNYNLNDDDFKVQMN